MEARLGHDFSQVRVHSDDQAAESARAVNAYAYTVGQHVVFGDRQFGSSSTAGRELLAHELAHVIQQRAAPAISPGTTRSSRVNPPGPVSSAIAISPATSPAEAEADRLAARAVTGSAGPFPAASLLRTAAVSGTLQRRTVRMPYATAAFETGPVWDVSLVVTGVPERSTDDVQEFLSACQDGIRGAAEALGNGSSSRSR
ncbi:MAG TPA: DUF4157 domain-containing protein, partial [Chloroflexota bacterium]|nr:DUF4157 domain-containing protein [Chloroflexota bacterium]